jgi:cell division protein FtsQ
LFSKRDSSVLDAPEPTRALREGTAAGLKRRAAVTEMPLRRAASYASNDPENDDSEFTPQSRRPAVRVSFRAGLLPKSRWARITAGIGFLLLTTATIAAALWVRTFLLHDEHFIVPTSESIQIAGNSHLTRAQLLSVFGEDVDRNIFTIPLAQRRAELESLPWVAHATVMRLLPNRVRVAIVERTPVAFVRQGTQIGLVDANGVLFDLPAPDMQEASGDTASSSAAQYSFPVLTGILAGDPLSTRAARMKIYTEFISALDATGEGISHRLSEVNVSNPEDVQAIIPDSATSSADVLVHFGEEKYLERYHQYQAHLAEWRAQYPKLASADMRYDQQVVLEMQKDSSAPAPAASNPATATPPTSAADAIQPRPQAPKSALTSPHPAPSKTKPANWKSKPIAKAQPKWHAPAARPLAQGATR